jgi:hypothetical protein
MYNGDPGFSSSGKDFLSAFLKGSEDYRQSGTDIPSFGIRRSYVGGVVPGEEPFLNEQIASVPVGQDPNFRNGPLSQEDFSEMVNYGLDLKKYGPSFKAAPPASPQLPRFLKPV